MFKAKHGTGAYFKRVTLAEYSKMTPAQVDAYNKAELKRVRAFKKASNSKKSG